MSGRVRLAAIFALAGTLIPPCGCRKTLQRPDATLTPWLQEVRLPDSAGFDAYLVHASDVGVWTVQALPLLERYACSEIVALDDRGRCTVFVSYSGKWTPTVVLQDGAWLGAIAREDIDPRRQGKELYVGGKNGNLYQIAPHHEGGFDVNRIAHLPGREMHTLAAADFDPTRDGIELFLFTRPGGLFLLEPVQESGSAFVCHHRQDLAGRVRDAVVLPGEGGAPPTLATVARTGEVSLIRFASGRPETTVIYQTTVGLGRIAASSSAPGDSPVLYITADDGRVIRLERDEAGRFESNTIYAGPQGPRGLCAGRFHEDPAKETVAVFGYSKRVELLTREQDRWTVETIFEDVDKGHWLAKAELDGRNGTDELIASGYGKRVILLSRPPGYGLGRMTATSAR